MKARQKEYPVVMRMQGMFPRALGGFEKHRMRSGGDLGHVDTTRSRLNRRLLGPANWAQLAYDEIQDVRLENYAKELESLQKRRRKKELVRRRAEGPRDPWRATRHGPLREVILTANAEWFAQKPTEYWAGLGMTNEGVFEFLAKKWLEETFGADCVHAHADRDETAYHIHAVILPRATNEHGRRVFQPSVHEVIRNYEAGQDQVGAHFAQAEVGLTRGERRKQALRDALEHNRKVQQAIAAGNEDPGEAVPLPDFVQHVTPKKYRRRQELELADRSRTLARDQHQLQAGQAQLVQDREDLDRDRKAVEEDRADADTILGLSEEIADGDTGAIDLLDDDADTGPPDDPRTTRMNWAKGLMSRAFAKLREKARAEARAELASSFKEILKARKAISQIVAKMPPAARAAIASQSKDLARSVVALERDPDVTRPQNPPEPPPDER